MAIDADSTLRHRHRGSSPNSSHTLLDTVKAVEEKIEHTLLLAWDELPDWRRDNAFITTGYRPTSNSYRHSLTSIFSVHNESVNIWTHFFGAISFISVGLTALYLYETVIIPRYSTATSTDVLVLGCFFAGAFLCLGMSATYHALCNHSPEVAKWGNKLDYSGIVFLIVGSYMPALYYGFYCLPHLMEVYLSGVSCRPHQRYTSPEHADKYTTLDLATGPWLPRRVVVRIFPHSPVETLPRHDVRWAGCVGSRPGPSWVVNIRVPGARRTHGS